MFENSVLGVNFPQVSKPGDFSKVGVLNFPTPAAAPKAKVSGWRILDSVLGGGKTISEAYDLEKERPLLEQQRELARQAAIQRQAMIDALTPEQRLAATLAPEKYGEAVASGYRTDNVAAGSVLASGRGGASFVNPHVKEFADRFGTHNQLTGETAYSAPRGPTFAEQSEDANRRATAGIQQQNADTNTFQAEDASERGNRALELEAQKVGGDASVWAGGILMKMADGIPLTPSETAAFDQYKDMKRAENPMANLLAPKPPPAAEPPPAAPDPTIKSGKKPAGAVKAPAGIKEGQTVKQGKATYRNVGGYMVLVG